MAQKNLREPYRAEGLENRVQIFALGLAVCFAILALQFWNLQVDRLTEFQQLADNNRVWQQRLKSDRGVIYGRNGEIIADNRASADIVFVPGDCLDCDTPDGDCKPCEEPRLERICMELETLLGIDGAELYGRVERHLKPAPFTQLVVKRDVSRTDRVRIEEHRAALPGVAVVVNPQRRYHYGEVGGQMLGFLGEINKVELEAMREQGYFLGDLIGKGGLERQYEDQLHGQDGYMLVTKYASGRPQLRTDRRGMPIIAPRDSVGHLLEEVEEARQAPVSGAPLYLSLDMGLQEKCEDLLKGQMGAIVVLNAESGEVLAMASVPSYDPSIFVTRSRSSERLDLLQAPHPNPMFSLAYRENYPPGSVYKVILAAAALEEKIINENTTHFCPGHYRIGGQGRRWHCWRRTGHGRVNVVEALAYSCDVFFYNVGLDLGVERINAWSNKVALGVRTGIDLPGEIKGLIPHPEWKAQQFASKPVWDQRWFPGDTVNLSIGQGSAATTPLQNAVMMAAVVNEGFRIRPYLNRELGPENSELLFSEETLRIVREGLRVCVEKESAPSGTGKLAKMDGYDIIGKTGTAQIVSLDHHAQYNSPEEIPYHLRHHAWFVAGVMDRSPRIAICILVAHGHAGSSAAAPLSKEIVRYFYERDEIEDEAPLTVAQGSMD